jgi:type IV pilus assembly protein PilP
VMRNVKTIGTRWLTIVALGAALTACGSGDRELQAYIDEVKARPGGQIEPLPEVTPPPSFVYEAKNRRSPFVSDRRALAAANPNAVPGPDPDRPREFLEEVPLDTLTMVGTLSRTEGSSFGLVRDSEGRVHRVTVGNYVGQNYGRITEITDSEILLVELVPDTLGAYIERPAGIGLSD